MAQITPETEFPRSWTDTDINVSLVIQPYAVGLYMAGTKGKETVFQSGLPYEKLSSFLKKLQKNTAIKDLVIHQLGDYLKPNDFRIINL